jgi:hypothetical protein
VSFNEGELEAITVDCYMEVKEEQRDVAILIQVGTKALVFAQIK